MSKSDSNVTRVLANDGLSREKLSVFHLYENQCVSLDKIRDLHGWESWAFRIAYNDKFGGVIIQQQPGEGNRKHYHPDADENWVIMDGVWEWWIDGVGTKKVTKGDIIVRITGASFEMKTQKGRGSDSKTFEYFRLQDLLQAVAKIFAYEMSKK